MLEVTLKHLLSSFMLDRCYTVRLGECNWYQCASVINHRKKKMHMRV